MLVECAIGLLLLTLFLIWSRKRELRKLPPGEFGYPLIGKFPSMTVPFAEQVETYRKKYGNIFSWKIGSRLYIFISDYKIIKSAYTSTAFQDRPNVFSFFLFTEMKEYGIGNNNGINWQNMRRFVVRHLRDQGMGKSSLESVIQYEVECLVKNFKTNYTKEPTEIPLSLNMAILNILWKLIADIHYDLEDPEIQKFQKALEDATNAIQSSLLLFDIFPWLIPITPNFIKNWMGVGVFIKEYERLLQYFQKVIDDHRKNLNVNDPKDLIDDFLIEMKKNDEGHHSEHTANFTNKELLYTVMDLFSAGASTTATTIRWIILYLVKYPDVQRQIQKQIDSVVTNDRVPSLQDRPQLPLVDAAINEVMRIKTITPLGIYHTGGKDITMNDYLIPKGSILMSCMDRCHKDTTYWDNPNEFCPERFLQSDGSFEMKKDGFLPFSIGRRACPGEPMARMQLYFYVSILLQNFTFEAVDGENLSTEPDPTQPLFTIPKPYKFNIKPRNSE